MGGTSQVRGILGRCRWVLARASERGGAVRYFALGVGFTLVVIAGVVGGLRIYGEWRIGRVDLINEGEPVVVEVLADGSDTAIGEPFDLVSRAVLALPDGEYRLRVDGKGRVGRTYRFGVNRRETQSHRISLDEGRLLGGELRAADAEEETDVHGRFRIRFAPGIEALELRPGRADLIEWSATSLICRDGATGKVRWDALHPEAPFDKERDPRAWLVEGLLASGAGMVLSPAVDLDGDGTRDLLWYARALPALVALSGRDGAMLWNHVAELNGPGGPRSDWAAAARTRGESSGIGGVAGRPLVSDVDHDGRPDLLATVVFSESREEHAQRTAAGGVRSFFEKRVLVAVSGRSGTRIWSHELDEKFVDVPRERHILLPVMARGRQSTRIGYLTGTHWCALDPATGRVQGGPIELGFVPVAPVQHADLDGDGEPEIVALGPGSSDELSTLHAVSIKTRSEIWAVDVSARTDDYQKVIPRGWWAFWDDGASGVFPLVADLDGDGRSEIVVADSGALTSRSGYRGACLIDGSAGKLRWRRPMRPENSVGDGLSHLIQAPDLDGDGVRDVVAVSRYAGRHPLASPNVDTKVPERVYVDALSGKDGRVLWWWHTDLAEKKLTYIWAPLWWGRGPDGWPMVAIPLGGAHDGQIARAARRDDGAPDVVYLLEASTGRERHRVPGLSRARCDDLDGDGLVDLWGEVDGELRAFRGEAPEKWRAAGRIDPPGNEESEAGLIGGRIDFDGDGITDVLSPWLSAPGGPRRRPAGGQTAVARSGRDGRLIWKTVVDGRNRWLDGNGGAGYDLYAFPLPGGDLDRDGTPDVIVRKRDHRFYAARVAERSAMIELLSGRTGARLWAAMSLPAAADVAFPPRSTGSSPWWSSAAAHPIWSSRVGATAA